MKDLAKNIPGHLRVGFLAVFLLLTAVFHAQSQTTNVKTVDKANAILGDTLNFTITPSYSGSSLLENVTVRDFIHPGTTYITAGQGGTLTTFSPLAAVPGDQVFFGNTVPRVFAFSGGGTANFYAYDPSGNTWSAKTSAPGNITTGSALTSDGNRYLYAFQGGSTAFYRYDAVLDTWTTLASAPGTTAAGASLVYLDGKVYAFQGGSTAFYIYDIAGNSWTTGTAATGAIGAGGSLATDGAVIYGLRGGGTRNLYSFDPSTNGWTTLTSTGQNIGVGSGLVYADDGYFYATQGGGNNRILRYDPSGNSWATGTNAESPTTGGDLTTDGTNFYMTVGSSTTFVQRFYSATSTALTAVPATVGAGGALAYLGYPSSVGTSSMSATPNDTLLGGSFTVTLTVQATSAVTGVTPSALQVIGGTATVTGPTPSSANLAANTPTTFTWTVTPAAAGEFKFIAGATSVAATFNEATSNSVLVSPEGEESLVEWNLGSNASGSIGTSASYKYIYGFQGGTAAFWAYNEPSALWNNPTNPADPPASIGAGGSLTNDGTRYVYALRGGNTQDFYRFDAQTPSSGTWTTLTPTGVNMNTGASIIYLNGYIYALVGNNGKLFRRYDVANTTWAAMANVPGAVKGRGSLATDGTNVYALRGNGQKSFYRYNVATNTWTTLANLPNNVSDGGALRYATGAFYALQGGRTKNFYRYNIGSNTWSTLATTSVNVGSGGALAFDGEELYAFFGNNTTNYQRYDLSANSWTSLVSAPANVNYGGALTYLATGAVAKVSSTTDYKLVSGVTNVTVSMTVKSSDAINDIAASGDPTNTVTGGVTATKVSGPTLVTADDDISGSGDTVTYNWVYTITPGTGVGSIVFNASTTINAQATTSHSNSVIVSPVLTFSTKLNNTAPYPPTMVHNSAILNSSGGTIQNISSNVTSTSVPCTIVTSVNSQTNILCYGASTGNITLSTTGAAGVVTAAWTGPDSYSSTGYPTISNLAAGTYNVVLTDDRGCTATATASLTQPTQLAISLVSKTNILCNGGSTGSITVTGNGGTPPYTYSINGTNYFSSGTFTGLTATTHTLYVNDNNNCGPVTTTVTLTQPAASLSVTPTVVQPTCFLDGSITLAVSGGTAPYTYDWSDLAGTSNPKDRHGLSPGSYTVTVTDANGCTQISGPHTITAASGCTGIVVCRSDAASVFSTAPDPANSSYTWEITPPLSGAVIVSGQGTPTITINWNNVTAGTYQVCVTANNVCGTSTQTCQEVYIHDPVAFVSSDPVCNGNDLHLYASGGVTYSWTGPALFSSTSPNPVVYGVVSPTNNGYYKVTAYDYDGCPATDSVLVTILANPSVAITSTTAAGCGLNNGSVDITASGGIPSYLYAWSNATTNEDLSNVYAGNYTVTVTDANSCQATATASVGNIGGPSVSGSLTHISCYGGSNGAIDITVSGGSPGYTYLWSDGNTSDDRTGLVAGTYSVTVTDALGCIGTASFTITQPNALLLDKTKIDILCFGGSTGSIDLIVSGGTQIPGPPYYTYAWTGPGGPYTTEDLSGLAAGTYNVTVTDNNSCTAITSVTLTQPTDALSATSTVTDLVCNGSNDGQIVLFPAGGTAPYTYVWSKTGGGFSATTKDITGLAAGTYHVTITDANSCTYTVSNLLVTQPDLLVVSGSSTNISCFGGSNGSITLTTVSGGTPPRTFLWNTGATTQNLTLLSAGTYTVTVTDDNGCTATTTPFTLTQPTQLTAAAVASDASCFGTSTGDVDLTATDGTQPYSYLWSNGQTTEDLSNVPAGTYSVTVTDFNGCTAVASATVNQPDGITLSASVTNVLCNGASTGAITLTVNGGTGSFNYDWNDLAGTNNGKDRTLLAAGTYTVTVTDANSCTATASYTITQPAAIVFQSVATSDISCKNLTDGFINITVNGGVTPYTYIWSGPGGYSATTEDVYSLGAGTYFVTITDANSCQEYSSGIILSEPDALGVTITVDNDVTCNGGNDGQATAAGIDGTSPYQYAWSNGTVTAVNAGLVAGSYTVTVIDANGCTATLGTTLTEPANAIQLYASTTNSSSCSAATGAIDLLVVYGVAPFTFNWSNGYTGEDPSGLAAGSYNVTVTDFTGCTSTLTGITIGTATALSVTVNTIDRNCQGPNGEAYATATGGVQPYTYLWSPGGATTDFITGLAAGTYNVTVTDVNGCTAINSGTVNVPSCQPPVAVDDSYSTPYLTLVSGDVEPNDSDPDHANALLDFIPLTIPTPAQGIIVWSPSDTGTFVYYPAVGYYGTFTVDYQVCDPTGLCDVGTVTITVDKEADLSIAKTNLPDPAVAGSQLTYTIVVTNNGPTPADAPTITDNPLPTALTLVEHRVDGGLWTPGWPGSYTHGTELSHLAPNNTITIDIRGTIALNTCSPISNTASVSSTTDDPNVTNSTTTLNTAVDDNTPPQITDCPDDYSISGCNVSAITGLVYDATGVTISLVQFQGVGGDATDNCSFSIVYKDTQSGSNPIVVTRTFTVTDAQGNSTTCQQLISIYCCTDPIVNDITTTVCSGAITNVSLPTAGTNVSPVSPITQYVITAVKDPGLTGTPFTGTTTNPDAIKNDAFTNTSTVTLDVTYTIVPWSDACEGDPFDVIVSVYPHATMNDPADKTICNGGSTGISLSSSIPGVIYKWVAAGSSANVAGYANCNVTCGNSINQVLLNGGTTIETVTYTITPEIGGCPGTSQTVVVTVNPTPVMNDPADATICSGSYTSITLTTPITGVTVSYSWTAALTSGTVTGFSSGTGTPIAQLLTNTGTSNGVVTYTITPSIGSCTSTNTQEVEVTVRPVNIITGCPVTRNINGCNSAAISTPAFSLTIASSSVLEFTSAPNSGTLNNICGIASVTYIDVVTDPGPCPIQVTRTWNVTDNFGNTQTCVQLIEVEDGTVPIAICQNITVPLNALGNATITAADINSGSSDLCGIASLVASKTAFGCDDVGPNTVTLTVTDVCGNTSTCSAIVTITDPNAPTLSINDITVAENAGSATFTVSMSQSRDCDVTFTVNTANNSALSASDYTSITAVTYTIPAGSTSVNVIVPILDDAVGEPTETYFVNLSNPSHATILDGQGIGTITDNDAVSVAINDVTVNENDGTATFTVTLTGAIQDQLTVDYATAPNTAL
ncbi:MAG TPA: Calx-beta domain-containing protein, partial [Bacteroidales bacterium]|nr:Calx-beta domain-containing protein [Bacteroidales bacterium]